WRFWIAAWARCWRRIKPERELTIMARRLFVVEKSFVVRDMLVLLPGIVPQDNEQFAAGGAISLRLPNGTIVTQPIASLEFMNPMPPSGAVAVALMVLQTQDVPVGAEVWSVDQ